MTQERSPERPRLSALVITRNESGNIARCLESLAFCDEIVVVDSESQDDTVEIARRFTSRVVVEPWRGYGGQKNFALSLCLGTWILWVDADEAVSPELADSIQRAVRDDRICGYRMRRQVHYLGRWIRHGGWGSDWVLRLFPRALGRFTEDQVHEEAQVEGPTGRVDGVLEHYSYRSLEHHWEKIDHLTSLWAEQAASEGRRSRWSDLLLRPGARWWKIYIFRLGFLDGWRGMVIAGFAAAYVLLKYAKLKGKERRS